MSSKESYILVGILCGILGSVFLFVSDGDAVNIGGGIFILILGVLSMGLGLTLTKEESNRLDGENRLAKWRYSDGFFSFEDKCIGDEEIQHISVDVALLKTGTSYLILKCENGETYKLPVSQKRLDEALHLRKMHNFDRAFRSGGDGKQFTSEDRNELVEVLTTDPALNPKKEEKDASVIGRAVAGQIIAGPAGAVVGALSAVDENNKNRK